MASKTTKGRKNTRSKKKDENESEKQQCKKYKNIAGEITILVILTVCILLVLM